METRANYLIVALFTLGVVLSAVLFVMWFSGTESGPKRRSFTVAFADSIAGLGKGSAVDFNGIRVGEVTRIYVDPKEPSRAYAELSVDSETPIRADTRASLSVGTLSGTGRISLSGGSAAAPELTAENGANPVIMAQQSGLAAVMETARGVMAKAEALRGQLNEIRTENQDTLAAISKNAEGVIGMFNGSTPGARQAGAALSEAGTRFGALEPKLTEASDRISALWQAANTSRIAAIRENGSAVMETLRANQGNADEISRNMGALSRRAGDLGPKVGRTLERGQAVWAAIDQDKIGHAMANIDLVQASFDASRADLEATQRNFTALSDKMERYGERFDRVRQEAADLIDSDDTGNAFKSVGLAVESVRRTSNRLSGHIQAISTAVTRLKGSTSRDLSTLGSDARRTMGEIDRASKHIKERPSSIIFGGSGASLPTYGGR